MKAIATLVLLFAAAIAPAQTIGGPIAITGNSLVEMAPWSASGIVPKPVIRGDNSYTCAMLAQLLPWDVAPGTKTAALVLATDDVLHGVTPQDHMACVIEQINWLLANRPGIKVVVANVPPWNEDNCYGDYRAPIAAYNALYATLPSQYPGSVVLADVWSDVVQEDGWAWPQDMAGPCGIHPGQPGQNNAGWTAFMAQVKQAIGH
jgi:hypothetical protein